MSNRLCTDYLNDFTLRIDYFFENLWLKTTVCINMNFLVIKKSSYRCGPTYNHFYWACKWCFWWFNQRDCVYFPNTKCQMINTLEKCIWVLILISQKSCSNESHCVHTNIQLFIHEMKVINLLIKSNWHSIFAFHIHISMHTHTNGHSYKNSKF